MDFPTFHCILFIETVCEHLIFTKNKLQQINNTDSWEKCICLKNFKQSIDKNLCPNKIFPIHCTKFPLP